MQLSKSYRVVYLCHFMETHCLCLLKVVGRLFQHYHLILLLEVFLGLLVRLELRVLSYIIDYGVEDGIRTHNEYSHSVSLCLWATSTAFSILMALAFLTFAFCFLTTIFSFCFFCCSRAFSFAILFMQGMQIFLHVWGSFLPQSLQSFLGLFSIFRKIRKDKKSYWNRTNNSSSKSWIW